MLHTVEIGKSRWLRSLFDRWSRVDVYDKRRHEIESAVTGLARNLGSPVRAISARSPWYGRFLYSFPITAFALFFLVGAIGAFWPALMAAYPKIWLILFGSFFVAAGIGTVFQDGLWRRGKKLLQPSADELRSADKRWPILFLRSFDDDNVLIIKGWEQESDGGPPGTGPTVIAYQRLEEAISTQLRVFGPTIAIGRPSELLPGLGAARGYFSTDEWQNSVSAWMGEALAIIMIAGTTPGLRWELAELQQKGLLRKLVILIVPRTGRQPRAKEDQIRQDRWELLRAAFSSVEGFSEIPERCPEGLIAIHLSLGGELMLVCGRPESHAADYERAIRFAFYGMLCHQLPMRPGPEHPLNDGPRRS